MKKILPLVAALALLGSCASSQQKPATAFTLEPLTSMYSYQILDSRHQAPIDLNTLAAKLVSVDAVFIGEFHSHQGSHLLQLQLLEALYRLQPKLVLSMEQFSRDHQEVVDSYLAGNYGEETLIEEGNAWETYKGSYRPLLEFAREHQLPVIAANAPAMHTRCVGREGIEILARLPEQQRHWSARSLDLNNPAYREKFFSFMNSASNHHGLAEAKQQQRLEHTFAAQLLRDTTMAESIARAMERHPAATIVHLNGAFHSDGRLGTVAVLQDMLPLSKLAVISPVMVEDHLQPQLEDDFFQQGDYIYLLRSMPPRYVDSEKQNQAIQRLLEQRQQEDCVLD